MSDLLRTSLINIANYTKAADLSREVVLGEGENSFETRTVAKGNGLQGDIKFFVSGQPTEFGRDNMKMRTTLLVALDTLVARSSASDAEKAAFSADLRTRLFGETGKETIGTDGVKRPDITGFRPLEVRDIKPLYTEAQRICARAAMKTVNSEILQRAEDLKAQILRDAALNGMDKPVSKLLSKFDAALAKVGERLNKATTPAAETKAKAAIQKLFAGFVRDATKLSGKMLSVQNVIDQVIDDYNKKSGNKKNGGTPLGDFARMAFVADATPICRPNMKVADFRAAATDYLKTSFLPDLEAKSAPQFLSYTMVVDQESRNKISDLVNDAAEKNLQSLEGGKTLFSSVDIKLPSKEYPFDLHSFLSGQPGVGDDVSSLRQALTEAHGPQSTDKLSVRLSANSVRACTMGEETVDTLLQGFCPNKPQQHMGLLAALRVKIDDLTSSFAAEFKSGTIPGVKSGNVYEVSQHESGALLVKISTNPESSLSASVTLAIGEDGRRTVLDFTGIQTNEEYKAKGEFEARKAELGKVLPTKLEALDKQLAQAGFTEEGLKEATQLLGETNVKVIRGSVEAAKAKIIETLNGQIAGSDKLDKPDFGDYQRTFQEEAGNLGAWAKALLSSHIQLNESLHSKIDAMDKLCDNAAAKLEAFGKPELADCAKSFKARFVEFVKNMQCDFVLTGTVAEEARNEISGALDAFAAKMSDLLKPLLDGTIKNSELLDLCVKLNTTTLPVLTFTTFTEEARAVLTAKHPVVTSTPVQMAAKTSQSPNADKVAESVAGFAKAVNNLLARSMDWKDEVARDSFASKAKSSMDAINKKIAEGLGYDADFSKEVVGLLGNELDILISGFSETEQQERMNELGVAVQTELGKLEKLEQDDEFKKTLASREFLADTLAAGKKLLANVRDNVAAFSGIPSRDSVQTFTMLLRKAVTDFRLGLQSYNGKGVPELAIDPKALAGKVQAENDVDINPFAGAFGGNVRSLDDLLPDLRAKAALGKQYNVDNPDLKKEVKFMFEGLDVAKPFLSFDKEGGVSGLHAIGDIDPETLMANALKQACDDMVTSCAAELKERNIEHVADLKAFSDNAEETFQNLLADKLRAQIKLYEEDIQGDKNAKKTVMPQPGELLVSGRNAFGLDLLSLNPIQRGNLDRLVLSSLSKELRVPYDELLARAATNEKQAGELEKKGAPEDLQQAEKLRTEAQQLRDEARKMLNRLVSSDQPRDSHGTACSHLTGAAVKSFAKSVRTGSLSLDKEYNEETLTLVMLLATNYTGGLDLLKDPDQFRPSNLGFGTADGGKILEMLDAAGIDQKCIKDLTLELRSNEESAWGAAKKIADFVGLMYQIAGCSTTGMQAASWRIFGMGLAEAFRASLVAGSKEADLVSGYEALAQNRGMDKLPVYEPLADMAVESKSALMFLQRQAAPDLNHVKDVLSLRAGLKEMQAAEADTSKEFVYGNVPFTLTKNDKGGLMAVMKVSTTLYSWDSYNQKVISTEEKGMQILQPLPLDAAAFLRQLEDEILLHVDKYGLDIAKEIFEGGLSNPSLSVRRQQAMNVIGCLTDAQAADLSHVKTDTLCDYAKSLLTEKIANPKAWLADELQKLVVTGTSLFNGEATLDLYREMNKVEEEDINALVTLPPEEFGPRDGETLAQSRIRQVHSFIGELIMPDDTTQYDLDKLDGKTDVDILRQTLLNHQRELGLVLRNLGGKNDLLDSFALAMGEPQKEGGEVPREKAFVDLLKAHMGQLQAMISRISGGDLDDFFRKLAGTGELKESDRKEIDGFLKDFSRNLSATSTTVLGRMQTMLAANLKSAFQKSMADSKGKEFWQKTLGEIAGVGTMDVDSGYGKFLIDALGVYFTKMGELDQKRMVSSLLRYSTNESNAGQLLGALVKGAGPVLQKFMQGLPQTALPPALRKAVLDLKSRLPSIPREMVRATLFDMVKQSNGRIQHIELVKSLGAATVGQAFLCRVFTKDNPSGEECVLKLLRPDVQSRARRERDLFMSLVEDMPALKDVLGLRLRGIFEEMDFTVEANHVKEGAIYNAGVVNDDITGVQSMKLFPDIPPTANSMVVRKAPGKTIDKIIAESANESQMVRDSFEQSRDQDGTLRLQTSDIFRYIDTRQRLHERYNNLMSVQKQLVGFMEKWVYEAIFGGGFFHGDLHDGNFLSDGSVLTVIDFGNAMTFSKEAREALALALSWIPAQNQVHFLERYEKLLTNPDAKKAFAAKKEELLKSIKGIFSRAGGVEDSGRAFYAIVKTLQEAGAEVGPLFTMMQSMQRLDETIRLVNEQLEDIKRLDESIVLVGMDESGKTRKNDCPIDYLKLVNDKMMGTDFEEKSNLRSFQKDVAEFIRTGQPSLSFESSNTVKGVLEHVFMRPDYAKGTDLYEKQFDKLLEGMMAKSPSLSNLNFRMEDWTRMLDGLGALAKRYSAYPNGPAESENLVQKGALDLADKVNELKSFTKKQPIKSTDYLSLFAQKLVNLKDGLPEDLKADLAAFEERAIANADAEDKDKMKTEIAKAIADVVAKIKDGDYFSKSLDGADRHIQSRIKTWLEKQIKADENKKAGEKKYEDVVDAVAVDFKATAETLRGNVKEQLTACLAAAAPILEIVRNGNKAWQMNDAFAKLLLDSSATPEMKRETQEAILGEFDAVTDLLTYLSNLGVPHMPDYVVNTEGGLMLLKDTLDSLALDPAKYIEDHAHAKKWLEPGTAMATLDLQSRQELQSKVLDDIRTMVDGFYANVTATVSASMQGISLNHKYEFEAYKDPTEPFSAAVNRGKDDLLKGLKNFNKNSIGLAMANNPFDLKRDLKARAYEERRMAHRKMYVDSHFKTLGKAQGVSANAVSLIKRAMADFSFPLEVQEALVRAAGKKSSLDAATRTQVSIVLAYNIGLLMNKLNEAGYGAQTSQPTVRANMVRLAATQLLVRYPEWARGLAGLDAAALEKMADGKQDLKTALDFLAAVRDGKPVGADGKSALGENETKAPFVDDLSTEEASEIEEMFTFGINLGFFKL